MTRLFLCAFELRVLARRANRHSARMIFSADASIFALRLPAEV